MSSNYHILKQKVFMDGISVNIQKTFPKDYYEMLDSYGPETVYHLALWAVRHKLTSLVRNRIVSSHTEEDIKKIVKKWKPSLEPIGNK